MRNRLSAVIGAVALSAASCALALPASGNADGWRPYSVDLMLKSESIGEAVFSPRGDRLLLEKLAAYDTILNFDWFMFGRERAMLLDVDLAGKAGAKFVSPKGDERLWLTTYSPSGARAAVGWFDGTVAKAGIYDVEAGTLQKLDLPASVSVLDLYNSPYWLSDDAFILFSQPAEAQRPRVSPISDWHERMYRLARHSWKGDEPGVTVLGSGKHWIRTETPWAKGVLLRVDARTGKSSALGSGLFWQLSLSPDRGRFAALREVADVDLTDVQAKPLHGMDKQLELVVYDFSRGGAEIIPCRNCNVTTESLRWSPGGSKLLFSTRVKRSGRIDHEYYIYDFRRGALERLAPKGIALATAEDLSSSAYVTPFTWLTDDTLAVRVTRKASPAAPGTPRQKDRHDWYALPPGRAPVLLTAGLKPVRDANPLENFVAVHRGKLLIMADGDLWQVAPNGTRRNLTRGIAEPLSPWCSMVAHWRGNGTRSECTGLPTDMLIRPADQGALAKGWLTFRIMKDDVFTRDLLFLNIDSGKSVRIARPDPQADLVSASALARAAVYMRKDDDGDRLLLVSADGATRELLHINQHLAGVAGGKPVLLTRREPGEAEERHDWLLLPPGHKPGQRHPLLVYFYPETQYGKEWRGHDLREVHFYNMHIAAARGYAVLMPSMRISKQGIPGNPMTEMHAQLVRAAENAVQAGYADPERWAITGRSYGGYGTNSVVTQTNRFKAAIAVVGPSNLTSVYAGSLTGALELSEKTSFTATLLEGGQGRMGAAPWQDPQRYIANSPLFHADRIQTPLLLIHGDRDPGVNVSEAEQMFHALLRQGKDAMFLRYWGEGHIIQSAVNIRDMWTHIFAWLDQHLDVKRDAQGNVVLEDLRSSIAHK